MSSMQADPLLTRFTLLIFYELIWSAGGGSSTLTMPTASAADVVDLVGAGKVSVFGSRSIRHASDGSQIRPSS